jgi:hypothetical protein
MHFFADGFENAYDYSVFIVLSGVVMGTAQWSMLRTRVVGSSWWVLATSAGWVVGWGLGVALVRGLGLFSAPWTPVIGMLDHGTIATATAIIYSLATGPLLVRLLRAPTP